MQAETVVPQEIQKSQGIGRSSTTGSAPLPSRAVEPAVEEFGYKPVPVLAPVSLFIGLFSIVGLVAPAGLAVSVVGIVLSVAGLWQIRQSAGELGGKVLTWAGFALAVGFLFSGSALHAYNYLTEVPEGYERLNFRWLAEQQPVMENGRWKVTPEVEKLDGKKVFLKGYMYPTRQQTGISSFVLCKDTGECCFGGQPKVTDMVVVEFQNGMTVDHREQQVVGVAGVFRTKQVVNAGELVAIYSLEGYHFR